MNEQAHGSDTSRQPVAAEIPAELPDVIPVPGQPGWFDVRVNESYYRCSLGDATRPAYCECPHREHRKAWCKHLARLDRELNGGWPTAAEEARACPPLTQAELLDIFR